MLRLDISVPACGLLSSHDDFSVVENLPEDAAVITQVCLLLLLCHHRTDIWQWPWKVRHHLMRLKRAYSEPCAARRPEV